MRAASEGKGACRNFLRELEYGLEYLVYTYYTGEGIKEAIYEEKHINSYSSTGDRATT